MEAFEVILLVLAYTLLIIALFLEWVCYQRGLETLEVIGLTLSLLFLTITLTISHFFPTHSPYFSIDALVLLAMIAVGLMTPLSVFSERHFELKDFHRRSLIVFAGVLSLGVIIGAYFKTLMILKYGVAIFLILSIIASMILIRTTKPQIKIAHREKIERVMSVTILIVFPFCFLANSYAEFNGVDLKLGFAYPVLFIFLAGSKLLDDIQRLSLYKPRNSLKEQNLKNYALTKREKEVAQLLATGATYKQISEQLYVSIPTVKTHVTNIYRKCQVKNKVELISLLIN